jgi:biopolymer transport protein ExbD
MRKATSRPLENLPNTANSDGSAASLASVTVGPKGELLYNEQPVTEAQLEEKLAAAGQGKDVTLIISADKVAKDGHVVHVMDLARSNNITKFAVQVETTRRSWGFLAP